MCLWICFVLGCSQAEKDVCHATGMSLRQLLIHGDELLCFCVVEEDVERNVLILRDKEGSVIGEHFNFRTDPVPYFESRNDSIYLIYDFPISRDSMNVASEKRLHQNESYRIGNRNLVPVVLRRWQGAQMASSIRVEDMAVNKKSRTLQLLHNGERMEVSLNDLRFRDQRTYISTFESGIYHFSELISEDNTKIQDGIIGLMLESPDLP